MSAACIFITEVVAYFSKNDFFLNFHYFVFVCGFDAGEQLFCCGCYQPLLGDLLIEPYLGLPSSLNIFNYLYRSY